MLVAGTLKLDMPLQDILPDFSVFNASFLETSDKGNKSDNSRQSNSCVSKSKQIDGSFKNAILQSSY